MKVEPLGVSRLEEAAELPAATQRAGSGTIPSASRPADAAEVIAESLPGALALSAVDRGGARRLPRRPSPRCPRRRLGPDPRPPPCRRPRAGQGRVPGPLRGRGGRPRRPRVLPPPHPGPARSDRAGPGIRRDGLRGRPDQRGRAARLPARTPGRRAGRGQARDVDGPVGLCIELATFHARSPVLAPAVLDVAATKRELVATVDGVRRTILVARDGPETIGMIEAHPDGRCPDTVTIGSTS